MNYQVDFLKKHDPKVKIAGEYYYTPYPLSNAEIQEILDLILKARGKGAYFEKELILSVLEHNIDNPDEPITKVFKDCYRTCMSTALVDISLTDMLDSYARRISRGDAGRFHLNTNNK